MSARRTGSDGNAERRPRPSDVSRDRLAAGISGDVADLRMQLEETILRSEAFLAAGFPDEASAVVDEQQALLVELRERIDSRVSAAKVEADAEAVLADTLRSYGREGVEELAGTEADAGDARPGPLRAARGAASALVGAVAAIALMVMASSPPGPDTFAAAGVRDDRDAPLAPEDGPETTASDESVRDPQPDVRPTSQDSERVGGPNDLEIRKLFATPGTGGRSAPPDVGEAPSLPVLQLQALVANVVSTVEGVAEAARDGWERAFDEQRPPQAEGSPDESEDDRATVTGPVRPAGDDESDAERAQRSGAAEPTESPEEQNGSDAGHTEDDPDDSDEAPSGDRDLEDRVETTIRELN